MLAKVDSLSDELQWVLVAAREGTDCTALFGFGQFHLQRKKEYLHHPMSRWKGRRCELLTRRPVQLLPKALEAVPARLCCVHRMDSAINEEIFESSSKREKVSIPQNRLLQTMLQQGLHRESTTKMRSSASASSERCALSVLTIGRARGKTCMVLS